MKTTGFEKYFVNDSVKNFIYRGHVYRGTVNIHPDDKNTFVFLRYRNDPNYVVNTVIDWIYDTNREDYITNMVERFLDVNSDNLEMMNYIWIGLKNKEYLK